MTLQISVVINNYNYEKFVGTAIQSVLDQTYPNVQCIVVDDGSKDDSLSIINSFNNIEVIAKPNGGQASAMLASIPLIKGNIVLFLDSDDSLTPNACKTLVEAYEDGVSMLQFKLTKVNTAGEKIGEYPDFRLLSTGHKQSVLNYGFIPACPTSGNAFSRDHVLKMAATISPETEGRCWIDGYLIYSAPFTGKVKLVDEFLGYYLVHGNNVSMAGGRTVKSVMNTLNAAVWQRKGYLRIQDLNLQDIDLKAQKNITPYHYRSALIMRKGYPELTANILPAMNQCQIARMAIYTYLKSPYFGAITKLKNIVTIGAVLILPAGFSRKLIPQPASV